MNINQLNYFIKLAHLQHYTQAAKELDITQPSLSHSIKTLEEELGVCLFEKKGRNIILNKYGREFLTYAEESLNVLDKGVKRIKEMTGVSTGEVNLAYIYTLGSEFIPQMVGDFMRSHEELRLQFRFTVGNTSDIIKGLKEEKFDLAFCSYQEEEEDIRFVRVGRQKLVTVVPKGHPLGEKPAVTMEEVAGYPQIFFTSNSGLRPTIERLFKKSGQTPNIACEIEEDGLMAGLVAQGFGIAVMTEIPVLRQLPVDVIEILNPTEDRYIYMAHMKDRFQSPSVKQFAKYVKSL